MDRINFTAEARAFAFNVNDTDLTLDGAGVDNRSAATQVFSVFTLGEGGSISFTNGASAGRGTAFHLNVDTSMNFGDGSTAGAASITNLGGSKFDDKFFSGGRTVLSDTATEGQVTITNEPA